MSESDGLLTSRFNKNQAVEKAKRRWFDGRTTITETEI
jgi:hypothetical protein